MAGTCRRGGCTAGTAGVESFLPRGPGTRGSHAMKEFGLTELGDSFQRLAGIFRQASDCSQMRQSSRGQRGYYLRHQSMESNHFARRPSSGNRTR